MGDVLINCEFSGVVRDAFRARGHNAISCDILPTDHSPEYHWQCDAREAMRAKRWDMMVFFAPCTFIANSGSKHLYGSIRGLSGFEPGRRGQMQEGARFFRELLDPDDLLGIPFVVGENPIMLQCAMDIIGQRAMQFVHPWHFGQWEQKATGFWSNRVPPLVKEVSTYQEYWDKYGPTPTAKPTQKVWLMGPGKDRQKERARFPAGLGGAMAEQWGKLIT